ncbi:MAG: TetR/AcrR family transcriptional regulator [bacterium]
MRVKEGNKEKDIINSAIKVFANEGYHKAKISQIAELANVATGSVYVYYKNKEDILIQVFEQLWQKLYDEMLVIYQNTMLSPGEKIDAMIDLLFDSLTEDRDLAVVFVNEQNHLMLVSKEMIFTKNFDKFMQLGENIFNEGIQKQLFSDNIDLPIFKAYLLGAIRNLLYAWAHDPQLYPLNKIRLNIKYLSKHGIQK